MIEDATCNGTDRDMVFQVVDVEGHHELCGNIVGSTDSGNACLGMDVTSNIGDPPSTVSSPPLTTLTDPFAELDTHVHRQR